MNNSEIRPIVSVLVECEGRTYRVIYNLRAFLLNERDRGGSQSRIGQKVLDLARMLDARTELSGAVPPAGKER